jgi:nicotinate-nucleotide pyrophosphorylase (carboxylating)
MSELVLPPSDSIDADVARALEEDLGAGDVSAALIDADSIATATILNRESGVLCGLEWARRALHALDPGARFEANAADGDRLTPNQVFLTIHGRARALLSAERTMLNFLQTLSGTATVTRGYVDAIADLPCRILDTRKTLPGLRLAQKYAVRCGGALNHRLGLYDQVLIKENHIAAAGSIAAAVTRARAQSPGLLIEVETESLDEVAQALEAGADRIMLDEFSTADLHAAVALNQGRAQLEVSGSVTMESLRERAATGVHFVSIGALTKHVRALDLSMRIAD